MTTKMTFSSEWRDLAGNLTKNYNYTTTAMTLQELMEDFEMFLKGCGYELPEGTMIDIVEDPSYQPKQEPFDLGHSSFYFDTTRNR